jgi:hypothetical protein
VSRRQNVVFVEKIRQKQKTTLQNHKWMCPITLRIARTLAAAVERPAGRLAVATGARAAAADIIAADMFGACETSAAVQMLNGRVTPLRREIFFGAGDTHLSPKTWRPKNPFFLLGSKDAGETERERVGT